MTRTWTTPSTPKYRQEILSNRFQNLHGAQSRSEGRVWSSLACTRSRRMSVFGPRLMAACSTKLNVACDFRVRSFLLIYSTISGLPLALSKHRYMTALYIPGK